MSGVSIDKRPLHKPLVRTTPKPMQAGQAPLSGELDQEAPGRS